MPGKASLAANEYYAHPRNIFWPVMETVINVQRELPYAERCKELTQREVPLALDDLFRAWSNSSAIDVWLHLEQGDWPACAQELGGNIRRSFEATEKIPLPWYTKVLRGRTALEARCAA